MRDGTPNERQRYDAPRRDGLTYRSLRFTAYGKRRRVPLGPVSEAAAEEALRHTLADVERGVWKRPAVIEAPPEPTTAPTFHEFAEEWWTLRAGQLAPRHRPITCGG
jgi:hypothetical protein